MGLSLPRKAPFLVSRHSSPGRRRAPGAVRRLPDGFSRLSATWAVKGLAGVAVLSGAAVALALPVDASPTTLALPSVSSSAAAANRTTGETASRSAARAQTAPVVTAPAAAPVVADEVGVSGVKAVAKPKPKPKPKAASGGSGSSSSAAGSRSYSTSITGRCGSIGLTSNAARLCSAVQSAYGLSSIGGYRPNAGEHSTGQAVDFMISGRGQGDAIAAFVQSHAGQFNVEYVIWRQRYWVPGAGWDPMSDRGSATANHYDHVHVTVN